VIERLGLPGVCGVAYHSDRYEKEPIFRLWLAVMLGMASTLAVQILHKMLDLPSYSDPPELMKTLAVSYITAGMVEELAKFGIIMFFVYRWCDLDEYYDGPLYAGMVGIGFAISENIEYMCVPLIRILPIADYLIPEGAQEAGLRILLQYRIFPAHFAFDFIAGYFVTLAKFSGLPRSTLKRVCYVVAGYLVAVVLHGSYNAVAGLLSPYYFMGYCALLVMLMLMVGKAALNRSCFREDAPEVLQGLRIEGRLRRGRSQDEEEISPGQLAAFLLVTTVFQFFLFFINTLLSGL